MQKGPDEKYCHNCGALIDSKAEICPRCGVRQPIPEIPDSRNKLVAALLAILLGGFGIHKFYLGRTGWGILYLLFCWTWIPSFLGVIEGIILLIMDEREFTGKYGNG